MENILIRISQLCEYEGITITELERKIGASKSVLSRALKNNTDIQVKWVQAIADNYRLISLNWLITGKGSMLKEDIVIAKKQDHFPDMGKMVPLVNIKAIGGFGNADFRIEESDIKDRYVIPKFAHKKIDFMIEVEGSSMSPLYNSGDIVACRIIHDRQFIQWNKVHVIASRSQGILIKRIKPANQTAYITMVSDNKDFDPFHIPDNDIEGIALVIGTIRLD